MTSQVEDISKPWAAFIDDDDRKYYMLNDEVFIGRSPEALIVLTQNTISRKHCLIKRNNKNQFEIYDSSNHGTYVNGIKLIPKTPVILQHLDKITIVNAVTYTFYINKKRLAQEKTDSLNDTLKAEMSTLESTQTEQLNKINNEIDKMGVEKTGLELEMKKQWETKTKLEKDMMYQLKIKIDELTKKEEQLKKSKEEMQIEHERERLALDSKWKAAIEALSKRLEDSEQTKTHLEGKAQEIEKMLAETRQNLLDSELEQNRIFEEKMEVVNKLETTEKQVIDLTERNATVSVEKEMEIKKAKEENEKYRSVFKDLEESLLCSICTEVFIDPHILDCFHSFCKVCIEEWQQKKKICPICRAKFKTTKEAFFYHVIIENTVNTWPEEAKKAREELILQRSKGKKSVRPKKRKHTSDYPRQHTMVFNLLEVPGGAHIVEQVPSTSFDNPGEVFNIDNDDPFHWNERPTHRRRALSTLSSWETPDRNQVPVEVAAIDLTNSSVAPNPIAGLSIDLTSP